MQTIFEHIQDAAGAVVHGIGAAFEGLPVVFLQAMLVM